jgi:hypothetical protein
MSEEELKEIFEEVRKLRVKRKKKKENKMAEKQLIANVAIL